MSHWCDFFRWWVIRCGSTDPPPTRCFVSQQVLSSGANGMRCCYCCCEQCLAMQTRPQR